MNDLEKALERLQNSSRHTKNMIMWIGVPVIMAATVFLWLNYSDFGYEEKSANSQASSSPSNFEILKNGVGVSIKEFQSLFQNIKEKIGQTNNFNITAPENEATSTIANP